MTIGPYPPPRRPLPLTRAELRRRERERRRRFARRRAIFAVGILAVAIASAAVARWQPWRDNSEASATPTTSLPSSSTTTTAPAVEMSPNGPVAHWVVDENAKPGTSSWNLASTGHRGDLEGYVSTVSATAGQTVPLYVSTVFPTFHIEAYRMGWYQGLGGRLVWQSPEIAGKKQAAPVVTPGINMVEARWQPSAQVSIDSSFPPGEYLLKLVAPNGVGHWIPLTIRDDASTAAYLVQSSVTTWQAYNLWGGYSLYGKSNSGGGFAQRSRVVSFDRPYDGTGAADFPGLELPFVMLVEQLGLDVTYTTDVDVHTHPELLLHHKMFASLGHDEYWSKQMRDGVEAARDHGVNLAFFGANASFRQIRLEDSPTGPNRREVCYKSATGDPIRKTNPQLTTVNWRDAPVSRPERLMIGEQYESNPVRADMVIVDPSAWVFAGANVVAGQRLPIVVGSEYDRYVPSRDGPTDVEVLAHSPLVSQGKASFSDMIYYSAPSGAGVFATGTIFWITKLTPTTISIFLNNPVVTQITKNVLAAFGTAPAGSAHPSTPNSNVAARGGPTSPPPLGR